MDKVCLGLLAALVASVSISGCLGSEPFDEPVPVWLPGYAWTSTDTVSVRIAASASGGGGSDAKAATIDTTLRSSLEVLNGDAAVAGRPAYLAVLDVRLEKMVVNGTTVYPGAGVPSELLDASCASGCAAFVWIAKDDLALAEGPDGPAQATLSFPLTNDKQWTVEGIEVNGVTPSVEARAVDLQDVTLQNGQTVRAVRITTALDSGFAKQQQATMRKESGLGDRLSFDVKATGTDLYAPAAKWLVQSAFGLTQTLGLRGDGGRVETEIDIDVRSDTVDFVLTEKPARTMEAYLGANGAVLPLPPAEPWAFSIDAPVTAVDAAAGETHTFTAEVDGGIPDAAIVRWELRHDTPFGPRIERAAGASLPVTFDRAGLYAVYATVHDAGGVLRGTAAVDIDAFTRTTLAVSDPAGVSVLGGSDVGPAVEIAPGASSITLTVTPQVVAVGTASLVGANATYHHETMGGQETAEVDAVPGLYNLTWSDKARVGPVELVVEVHYAAAEGTGAQAVNAVADACAALAPIGGLRPAWLL